MKNRLALALIGSAALALVSTAQAESVKIDPGQWKNTMTSTRNGQTSAPHSGSHCVTQEDADNFSTSVVAPFTSQQPNCSRTLFKETAKSLDFKYHCTGASPATIEGSIKFDSSTHYSGTIKDKATAGGQPVENTFTMEGSRLGDCTGPPGMP